MTEIKKNHIRPCGDCPITMAFGEDWSDGKTTIKNHKGIDYALPIGEPVWASAPGVVKFAGQDTTGYGNLVVVEHFDCSTYYAHLDAILVDAGEIVQGVS